MNEEKTKSFAVSKEMVYDSYLKVCDKNGSAGIDKETIDMFNENLSGNLFKVWNRMSSGSYFPPAVCTVLIPKKQGGTRPLGIPTVGDHIMIQPQLVIRHRHLAGLFLAMMDLFLLILIHLWSLIYNLIQQMIMKQNIPILLIW